ncbi:MULTISPECIES: hypothetical protein [unclassified Legionella]|uniref:hypothetical protein n=1 Tax=unclassified Legionella TaxID=2622702 RepID=UPI001E52942B|nr:hypothetical protein [Legionella sp. 31fI33]MCC5015172.1 hypothetical protein [Legionella sp. 31fI33]
MFYINDKQKVIRKLPSGKAYKNTLATAGIKSLEENLPSGNHLTLSYLDGRRVVRLSDSTASQYQSEQKGGLCWYYASKTQWFGKFYMGPERNYEKIISTYRKICTYQTKLKAREDAIVDWFNEQFESFKAQASKEAASDTRSEFTELAFANMILQHRPASEDAVRLFQDFLGNGEFDDLTYFTLNRQAKALIDAITAVSQELRFDVKQAVSEVLEASKIDLSLEELSLDELSTYYDRVIINHIWRLQGCTPSSWHPAKGLQALVNELREGLCIAEIDYDLIETSAEPPVHQFAPSEDDGYLVHTTIKKTDNEKGEETHIIKIIGAELEDGGNIYFIDPNDASAPDKPRIVHKIPYDLFCEILQDEHGASVQESMSATTLPRVLHRMQMPDNNIVAAPSSPKRVSKRQQDLSPPSSPKDAPKRLKKEENHSKKDARLFQIEPPLEKEEMEPATPASPISP